MINHVRIYKQVYLPFEIVIMCSGKKTNCMSDNDEISPMRWSFYDERVEKPSIKCFKKWNKFVELLRTLNIKTEIDFKVERKYRWTASENGEIIRYQDKEEKVTCYVKPENGREIYKKSEKEHEEAQFDKEVLVTYLKNECIKRLCTVEDKVVNVNETNHDGEHNEYMIEDIEKEEVFACIDASIKGRYMRACYSVVNDMNTEKIEGITCADQ